MRTKALVGLAVVATLFFGTAVIASNMGFKISIPLATTGDGLNFVSIPYYWSAPVWAGDPNSGTTTASDLVYDVNAAATNTECRTYNPATGTYTIRRKTAASWTGTDFAITPGVGYVIKVPAAVNYICVGSHNPSLSISFVTTGDGLNFTSIPYHFTPKSWGATTDPSAGSTTASDIIWDVNSALTNTECRKYNPATGTYTIRRKTAASWTGTDFAMVAGEAYVIKVPGAISWTPSHF